MPDEDWELLELFVCGSSRGTTSQNSRSRAVSVSIEPLEELCVF